VGSKREFWTNSVMPPQCQSTVSVEETNCDVSSSNKENLFWWVEAFAIHFISEGNLAFQTTFFFESLF